MRTTVVKAALVSVVIAFAASACGSSSASDTALTTERRTTTTTVDRPSGNRDELVRTERGRMHLRCVDPERLDVFPAFEQVATITSLGDLPMTIVTAAHRTDPGPSPAELTRLDSVWDAGMDRWANLSSRSSLVTVDDTGHHIEVDRPELVVEELLELIP